MGLFSRKSVERPRATEHTGEVVTVEVDVNPGAATSLHRNLGGKRRRNFWGITAGGQVMAYTGAASNGRLKGGPVFGTLDPDEVPPGVNVGVLRLTDDDAGGVYVDMIFGRDFKYRPRAEWD